jgi:hypothetical protein
MRPLLRRATAIIAAVALLLIPVSTQSRSARGDHTSSIAATVVAQQPAQAELALRGTGYWQKAACLGCVAGFLFVSGTGSVAAVIAVIAAYPEVAALCAAGCYAAYAI